MNNDVLFFKIFRNLYIKNIIIKYLRVFNNLKKYSTLTYYRNTKKVKEEKFRDYITYLNLSSVSDPNNLAASSIKYYFPNLEVLFLPNSFNEIIRCGDFSSNLKAITFGDDFTNDSFSFELCGGNPVLPNGIERVEFGFKFNNEICDGSLPVSLKSLFLGYSWNLNADKLNLPSQLEELEFGRGFEKSLVNFKLPSSLLSLIIKSNIRIGENVLPSGLKKLKLIDKYNYEIKSNKVLPSKLEYLEIGNRFKVQDLNSIFKSLQSLLVLKLGDEYSWKIKKGSLPPSLTVLEIGNLTSTLDPGTIGNSIKKVSIKDSFQDISSNSNSTFTIPFYNSTNSNNNNKNSITTITTTEPKSFLLPGTFPENQSLNEFSMGHYFNLPILPNVLPSTLKSIEFSDNYTSKLLNGSIPSSVERLIVNNSYCLNNDTLVNNNKLESLKINYQIFTSSLNDQDIQLPSQLKSYESNYPLKRPISNYLETLITKLPIDMSCIQGNSLVKLVIYATPSFKSSILNSNTSFDNFDLKIAQFPSTIKHLELIDIRITILNFKLVNFQSLKNLETLVIKHAAIVQVNSQLLPKSIKKLKLIQINGLKNIELSDLSNLNSLEIKSPYSNVDSFSIYNQTHAIESINLPSQLAELILNINTVPLSEYEKETKLIFNWNEEKLRKSKKAHYQPLISKLPESLTTLVYNSIYGIINEDITLPSSIFNLTLHSRFSQDNHSSKLFNFIPKSLQSLSIIYRGYLDFRLYNKDNHLNLEDLILNFIRED